MGKATSREPAHVDRRRSRSVASRQALVAAAIRSIAENGLGETTLARVSELSGLSRSLVAFHFASKDALIRAALVEANRLYDASWRQTLDAAATPRARLDAAIRHDIAFAQRHPSLLHVWFAIWGETQAQAIYRELALPMDQRYRAELTELARACGLTPRTAQDVGRTIDSFLYGIWLEAHLDPESFDAKRAARAGTRLLDALVPA